MLSHIGGVASFHALGPRCRVLILPPIEWLPSRRRHLPDQDPDLAVLERSLASLGVDVTTLDPMPWPWNPLHGQVPLLQGIDPLRALRVLLFYRHVDAVLCPFEGPALLLALLRRVMLFRPRLLMWDLGLTDRWQLRERIQDWLLPRLDGILVLGSNQLATIVARWPRHAPLACIGHYLDTAFWRPMPSAGGETGYVLCVGDDVGRDYDLLLEATAQLGCKLVIRSGQALASDARRRHPVGHLRSRVSFTGLRELYAGAAVVVVPLHDMSHASGVSAVLEAAAMGCAMVVSNSAGVRDWLCDGETCLAVPCGDAPALAAAIQRLLDEPALRQRLGQAARAFVERCCTPEVFARSLAAQLRTAPADAGDG
ncbi:MAG: hypothetical protein NVSMB6_28200 [Burkholderiaceae bacterium]